jgi:tetratricopeptide (TPR) repeat protein
MRTARHGAGPALALLLAAAGAPAAAQEGGAFDACEASFAADPDDWKECGCFYRVAIGTGLYGEAAERLERHRVDRPENPCLAWTLGRLRLLTGDAAEAAPLLRQALDGYVARGGGAGEVYARLNLADALAKLGASGEELAVELGRARRVAEEEADPVLRAEVAVKEAKLLSSRGGDVGLIEDSLREIRRTVFDAAHPSLQRDVLHELAKVLYSRGRFTEAEEVWTEAVDVTVAAEDGNGEAAVRASLVAAVSAQEPFPGQRERVAVLLEEAIDTAAAAGNRPAEIEGRKRLARLLGGDAGMEQIRLALDLAEPLAASAPALLADTLATSALLLLESDLAEARRRVDEAAVLLARVDDPWAQVHSWANRLHVLWETGPRDEALAVAESLLAIVDRLEEIQSTETARAEVSAVWTEIDQWLAGRLLLAAEESGAEREELMDRAFAASERMRARMLLESLTDGGVGPAGAVSVGDRAAWLDVQLGIVSIHRRLLDPSFPRARRRPLLDELRGLEATEDRLAARRRRLRKSAIAEPESFLSLDGLRADLRSDEAVLAFQVRPWKTLDHPFGGGSWLTVITADGSRVHRLPDPEDIAPAVQLFLGLFEGRAGDEAAPAAALHEMLLGSALAELPAGVERLVVIPDGPLHRLPFAALREGADGPRLAERYEIFVTPSATAWERLRRMSPAGGGTLALADPETLASVETEAGGDRSWGSELVLLPLPHSRREGRSVLRRLGRPGRLLLGSEASEAAVKRGLGGVCLLHLGTHAVLDERYPQRSAVWLAPGGPDEDGRLRPREAADLDLQGAVVVLASCQSAQGKVLSGEGALSLGRAFLEGGARAVVGTLWPIVDDEAADVFERFYWHLGRGETVAGALARAQRESLEAGDPAAAWAGLVVLGDGGAVVVPEPRPYALALLATMEPLEWALGLATAALLVALGTLVFLRARSRRLAVTPEPSA